MDCSGVCCNRPCFIALNVLFLLVGVQMLTVGSWMMSSGLLYTMNEMAIAIIVGVLLFLVTLLGIFSALAHTRFLLDIYMIILSIVFMMQFSVSCACLTLNEEDQVTLLKAGWNKSEVTQRLVEEIQNCCGFFEFNGVTCAASCFQHGPPSSCDLCAPIMKKLAKELLRYLGIMGILFSVTELWGIWLAQRIEQRQGPNESEDSPDSNPL